MAEKIEKALCALKGHWWRNRVGFPGMMECMRCGKITGSSK